MKLLETLLQNERIRIVRPFIRSSDRILDIGCGNGVMLLQLPNTYKVGIDKRKGVDVTKGLPFPENSFDCVTLMAVVEHLHSYQKVLKEIHRVLVPGGKVIITTPSPWGKWILEILAWCGILDKDQIHDHKQYFYPQKFIQALKDAGFVRISHRFFQWRFNNCYHAKK